MKLPILLLSALLMLATPALAADFSGAWVFAPMPDFPSFTMVRIKDGPAGPSGVITSQWYGDLPMLDLHRVGDTLAFRLDNGNARVLKHDFVLRRDGATLRLTGDLWYQHVDTTAHRGAAREVAALAFKTYPLPALRDLPENGLARTPPMGWNSWNKFAEAIDDKTVRAIADAMATSGLRDAGYVYINIDDGWQGARDSHGVLQPNAKFPDMKALADYVHAKGLKLGIYSSPGPKSCAGFPGSYGHVEQDARTWAGWGIDYLKYDLCSGEGFYRTYEQVRATYQQMGQALQSTGRPIVFSLCEYGRFDVGSWGRKVGGNLWRTTGDISDTYASMSLNGFDRNGAAAHTGPGGWNDPDMLEVGNGGMSEDEYRSHMTLWAIQAAPLLTGNDLRSMTPATLALLTNPGVVAVDQDRLGVSGRRVVSQGDTEIWVKPLAEGGAAVALFNRGGTAASIAVDWSALGAGPRPRVRDLWSGTELGQIEGGLTRVLPPHGAALLRLSPQTVTEAR